MRFLAIFKPERHESKPLPTETWAEFLELCKAYLDDQKAKGTIVDWGFAPGGDLISGFAIVDVATHGQAWYLLKEFPGYERTLKYDLIPIVEVEEYYTIELAKEAKRQA